MNFLPSVSKKTSLPAVVEADTASSGRFAAAAWNLIRQWCCSLAVTLSSASPRFGMRPPSAAM
eukprot:5871204-Alexandrium_andersonii.AAC.1